MAQENIYVDLDVGGSVTATSFSGSGANLTNLNAGNVITGTLAVARGGTGIASYTANNYIRASDATTLEQRTPAQVLADIGAANAFHDHDEQYADISHDHDAQYAGISHDHDDVYALIGHDHDDDYAPISHEHDAVDITTGNTDGARLGGNQSMDGIKTFTGTVSITGTSKANGRFYGGTTAPTMTQRLNYDGYLYATRFYGDGSFLSNIAKLVNTDGNPGGTIYVGNNEPTSGLQAGDVWLNAEGAVVSGGGPGGGGGGGDVPAGAIMPTAAATAPSGWLLCHGQAVSRTTFSDLFSVIGTAYGAGNGSTTFNIPDLRGRVIAAIDSGDVDFDTRGKTGGSKEHELTIAEIPSHTHSGPSHTHSGPSHSHSVNSHTHGSGNLSTSNTGGHNHSFPFHAGVGAGTNNFGIGLVGAGASGANQGVNMNGAHSHNISGNTGASSPGTGNSGTGQTGASGTAQTGSAGSNNAHNNVQPYMALHYIIRT